MSADCPDAPECAMKSAQATAKRKIDTLENVASVLDRIEALRSARSIDLAAPQPAPTTILRRSEFDDLLDRIINSTDDWQNDVDTLLAHDAALRAENALLKASPLQPEVEAAAEDLGKRAKK